jgi:hypothetical protein
LPRWFRVERTYSVLTDGNYGYELHEQNTKMSS